MDILFLAYWIVLPVAWFYLLRLSSIRLFEISIPAILIWFIFFFSYVGFPILWFELDPYRSAEIQDKGVILSMFLHTAASISFLLVGFYIGKMLFGSLHPVKVFEEQLYYSYKQHRVTFFLFTLVYFICCTVLYIYISNIGLENLALLVALDFFSEGDLTSLRSNATNALDNYSWYRLFTVELLLVTTFFFFSLCLSQKNKYRYLIMLSAILISSFSLLLAGEKGQIIEILLGLFLVYCATRNGGKFSPKSMMIFSILGILIVIPVYWLLMDSNSLFEAGSAAFSRLTTGQLQPMYVYFEYIPAHREFLMGKTFPNPGSIFPYEAVTITQEAMAWYNPLEASMGIVGSLPAMFWVEAYINFGSLSIIPISFLLGLLVYSINKAINLLKVNPITISLFVWLTLFYKDLSVSFFSDYLINSSLFIVLLIGSVLYLLSNKGRIFFR